MAGAAPTSVNTTLFDRAVRHAIYLERFKGGEVKTLVAAYRELERDLLAQLAKRDPTAVKGRYTQARLANLIEEVREIIIAFTKQMEMDFRQTASELAEIEVQFQAKTLSAAVPVSWDFVVPSAATARAAVFSAPMQGRFLSEWFAALSIVTQDRVRAAIRIGVLEGEGIREIAARLKIATGQSSRGAQMVVRTAVNHVSQVARQRLYDENAEIIKGVRWVATLDGRTSAVCRSRDGEVYPVDSGPRPPAHPNCLPADALVLARDGITGACKRWYQGELVVIRTASGKKLSCTPNHPILTHGGWVAASLLHQGDDVVCDAGVEWKSAVDVDHENMPARIEDVAEAFFKSAEVVAVPVPTASEDFHGDGIDGEIAIVSADRFLAAEGKAASFEHLAKPSFVMRNEGLRSLPCDSALDHFSLRPLPAADSVVSGNCKSATIISAGLGHSDRLLLGAGAASDAMPRQDPYDNGGRYPEDCADAAGAGSCAMHLQHPAVVDFSDAPVGQLAAGLGEDARNDLLADTEPNGSSVGGPGFVVGIDHVFDGNAVPVSPDLDAPSLQPRGYGGDGYPELACQILSGSAGAVFLDQIVAVDRETFAGHVFNLETEKGFYCAGGIITHNCRSSTAPVLKSWRELGIDLNDAPEGTRASMDGQVPASTTYQDWLKGQPAALQDEVLGKARGALFRRGGLTLDKFVMADGSELALDELRAKYPEAFADAGVWPGRGLMAKAKRERIVRDHFGGGYGAAVERAEAARSPSAKARLRLSEAEQVMLWGYTTEGGRGLYEQLNGALRAGNPGEVDEGLRDTLTAALRKLPVHRGIVERRIDLSDHDDVRERLLRGEFSDGGFVSASIEGTMTERPDLLYIKSATGRKIQAWSSLAGETEVLFSPDARFAIVEAYENDRGGVTAHLEELE